MLEWWLQEFSVFTVATKADSWGHRQVYQAEMDSFNERMRKNIRWEGHEEKKKTEGKEKGEI